MGNKTVSCPVCGRQVELIPPLGKSKAEPTIAWHASSDVRWAKRCRGSNLTVAEAGGRTAGPLLPFLPGDNE